jgi:ferredoxin-type protein NapH
MFFDEAPRIAGFIYVIVTLPLIAFLWYRRLFSRSIGIIIILITCILGALLFAPMAPLGFQVLILHMKEFELPFVLVILGFSIFVVLTLLFGRVFCAFLCPIGGVQELAFYVPAPKLKLHQNTLILLIRRIFLVGLIVLAYFFSINLFFMAVILYHGARDFFFFQVKSVFFLLFIVLLLISIVLYRPFCRFICPYGALLSLAAMKGIMKLRRSPVCNDCGICERVCPADEAGCSTTKAECYLCGRCMDHCPVKGAIRYGPR